MATVAKQQYHGDDRSIVKVERTMEVEPGIIEKIGTIQEGAEKNVIQTVRVNGTTVPVSPDDRSIDIAVPHVIDDFYSTSDVDALSANMGRALSEEIMHLKSIGRFLSLWSCELGMPTTQPPQGTYKYKTGDYFIVSKVAGEGGTNYRPEGKQYLQGDVSKTVETEKVKEGDTYFYDGEVWTLQVNTEKEIVVDDKLSLTSENPVQNKVITARINEVAQEIPTLVSQLENDAEYITEEAIPDISGKLDKIDTKNQLYGTDNDGNQTSYELSSGVKANTVVIRGPSGVVNVGTPTSNSHAATKKYVDEAVENVEIDVDDELSNTSVNPVQNKVITEKINELELLKTPNATIIGTPTIVAGNISGFSSNNYLIAPFLSSFAQNPFILHMDFTTNSDITTQQNIVDSEKGLAFAIRNKRFVVALSTDGSSWLGEFVGSNVVIAETNYHVEIEWTGTQLLLRYSTDGTKYTTDITADLTAPLSGKVLYFGGHGEADHPFKGTFNFNEWWFKSNGNIVWRGMDAAGLETRANLSLNNLDEEGNARFDAKQDVIEDLETIRDGASKGATALQPGASSDVLTEGTTKLLLTQAERNQILATSGVNTGDETTETIRAKLGVASTTTSGYLVAEDYVKFNNKQPKIDDLATIRDGASKGATALQSEEDPIFVSSPAYTITQDNITSWSNKQNAITDLSTIRAGASKGATALQSESDPIFTASVAYGITAENIAYWNDKEDVIEDLDEIRTGASLGATALQSFTETDPVFKASIASGITQNDITNWNGKQSKIDDLNTIRDGASKGATALQTETDPVFSASVASGITSGDISNWNSKQSAINDLSTIRAGASKGATAIQEEVDPVFKASAASNITNSDITSWNSKQEAIEDLSNIRAGATLGATALQSYTETDPVFNASAAKGIKSSDITNWNSKQANISDLEAIRAGAALGATALQSFTETDPLYTADKPNIALKSEIPDISGKLDKDQYVGGVDLTTGLTFKIKVTGFDALGDNEIGDNSTYQTSPLNSGAAHWSSSDASGMKVFIKFDKPTKASAVSLYFASTNTYGKPSFTISGGNSTTGLSSLLSRQVTGDGLYQYSFDEVEYQYYLIDIPHSNWIDLRYVYIQNAQDGILSYPDYNEFKNKQEAISDLATIRDGASKGATAVQPAVLNSFATLLDLTNGLKEKQDKALVTTLANADDTHYPSAKAVADAMSGAGFGDMLKATYDPNNVGKNAFDYNNFINTPTIVDNVTTDSSTSVLSAKQGKLLQDQIDTLEARGHFLSNWNATTGQPVSFPLATPYEYTTGDYYIVTVTGTNNKKPSGTSYEGTASTEKETEELAVGDVYTFDGQIWLLQVNHGKTVSFANLSGNPSDNVNLANALNSKQALIDDLDTIRSNASTGGAAKTTIDNHIANTTVHVTASDKVAWSQKQNAISDLETIRSNAALGATALQPGTTSDDITQGSTNLYLTSAERTKIGNTSGVNTGDETASTIKTKLGITTLSGSNTGDETTATIKSKLGVASDSTDGYLTASDYQTFAGKQEVISDLATIRDGASKGATALQTETDPVFSASPASGITNDDLTNWNGKVSANNPTITISNAITGKVGEFTLNQSGNKTITIPLGQDNKPGLVAGGNWLTINQTTGKMEAGELTIDEYDSCNGKTFVGKTTLENRLASKQDTISDLATIRSGAALGATALQSFTEEDPTVPSHVKSITSTDISNWNGKQGAISDLETIRDGASKGATALQSFTETDPIFSASVASGITSTDISNWNGKQSAISDLATIRSGAALGATALQSFTESDPTVPSHVKSITQTNINNWNSKGTYSKPSGGIPSTDLSNAVQASLVLADSALQSETDPTVPAHVKNITQANITSWNNKFTAPSGGTEGQVLTKTASGTEWADASSGGSETVYLTEDEYNNLPDSKLTDGKDYVIYGEGGDLDTYATKAELAGYATESELNTLKASVVSSLAVKNIVSVTSLPSNPDANTLYIITS